MKKIFGLMAFGMVLVAGTAEARNYACFNCKVGQPCKVDLLVTVTNSNGTVTTSTESINGIGVRDGSGTACGARVATAALPLGSRLVPQTNCTGGAVAVAGMCAKASIAVSATPTK